MRVSGRNCKKWADLTNAKLSLLQYSGKKVEKKDTKSATKPKKTTPTKKTTFKKTKKVSKK